MGIKQFLHDTFSWMWSTKKNIEDRPARNSTNHSLNESLLPRINTEIFEGNYEAEKFSRSANPFKFAKRTCAKLLVCLNIVCPEEIAPLPPLNPYEPEFERKSTLKADVVMNLLDDAPKKSAFSSCAAFFSRRAERTQTASPRSSAPPRMSMSSS